MKQKPTKKEAVEAMSRDIEEDVKDEAGRNASAGTGVDSLDGLLFRVHVLEDRTSVLRNMQDAMEGEINRQSDVLPLLANLFDRQIDAALVAAGCQQSDKERTREYALGLGFTAVAGKSSANINVQPQVAFRPERLVIPPSIAEHFIITDIKVGKNSQLIATGALPASAFTNRSGATHMKMDTAQVSMFITISVYNTSDETKNFQGVFFGPSVEEDRMFMSRRRHQRGLIW